MKRISKFLINRFKFFQIIKSITGKLHFSHDKYFHSRPSIVGYNAGGSNKANANPKYPALIKDRIDSFMVHYPKVNKAYIPSEIITVSGSGFDPYIFIVRYKN